MKLKLVEPLRELFKDEVRQVGLQLGLPHEIVYRQPFPGPGLAVRILGEVTRERLRILRDADAIVVSEMKASDWYYRVWQSFAVLLPVKSVGVMGDERTYESTIAVRIVESQDGMTADWVRLPYDLLAKISTRIINEVKGVNRVCLRHIEQAPGDYRVGVTRRAVDTNPVVATLARSAMSRKIIATPDAPKAVGPYSQAVAVGQSPVLLRPDPAESGDGGIDPRRRDRTDHTGAREPGRGAAGEPDDLRPRG